MQLWMGWTVNSWQRSLLHYLKQRIDASDGKFAYKDKLTPQAIDVVDLLVKEGHLTIIRENKMEYLKVSEK